MDAGIFIQNILNIFKAIDGNVLEACSTLGDIKLSNISFQKSPIAMLLPAADYKTEVIFFDDDDANIINVTYLHSVMR
jgi:hypothetical protein